MNDTTRLRTIDESGYGDSTGMGGYNWHILCAIVALVMMVGVKPAGAVYSELGQALKTVAAFEDTLLDRVIAATEIGVRSSATGKKVTGWGVSKFAGNALGPLVTIGLAAGGVLWSPVIEPWLQSHGWWYDSGVYEAVWNGGWVAKPGVQIGPMAWSITTNGYGTASVVIGYDLADCENRVHPAQGWTCNCTYVTPNWVSAGWPGGWGSNTCCFQNAHAVTVCMKPSSSPDSMVQHDTTTGVVANATIQTQFETDFGTDGSLARQVGVALVNYLGGLVDNANRSWPDTVPEAGGYAPLTDGQGATVQQAMNDALDAQAKTQLQGIADANGTSNPPGSQTGQNNDWEYTPEQIAAAQYIQNLALDDKRVADFDSGGGNDDNGSDNNTAGSYTIGARSDLAALLLSYTNSMAALPVVSVVQNSGVTVTGAVSYIDLPLPALLGGNSIHVNFADYESYLIGFGNLLYAFVGFHWLMWLFMGRGDA
jgi:hypothetical protein